MPVHTRGTATQLVLVAAVALGAAWSPAGAQTPSATARVEEQVLLEAPAGTTHFISPKGQHVAAVVNRGSRVVVVHDGVDGPRYDEICPCGGGSAPVIEFSDDGSRFAYLARLGQELIYVVDGKELVRVPTTTHSLAQFGAEQAGLPSFDASGKRVHFELASGAPTGGNLLHRVYIDGQPGPPSAQSIGGIAFSPKGERHAYLVINHVPGGLRQTLVVDGKPAPYLAGEPQFTADGKSLFTTRPVPSAGGSEILLDGKQFLPVRAIVRLHVAPAGSLVIGVVTESAQPPYVYALTVGNRKVPGSECGPAPAGIDGVYFTADGKHWAARCNSPTGSWVMVDGKKGQNYQTITSDVLLTTDLRAVYHATSNNKFFVVVGDQESGPYELQPETEPDERGAAKAAVVAGNRVAFAGRPRMADPRHEVVIDGKATPAVYAGELGFSPDGSRVAYWTAATGASGQWLVVDGAEHKGFLYAGTSGSASRTAQNRPARHYAFSPDGKHVAYFAYPASNRTARGIALDGKLVPLPNVRDAGNITFTPDSRHIIWLATLAGAPRQSVFVDGRPVVEIPWSQLYGEASFRWSMGADGVLTFIAQDGDRIKRYRVTPGAGTSIDALLAAGGRGAIPTSARAAALEAKVAEGLFHKQRP